MFKVKKLRPSNLNIYQCTTKYMYNMYNLFIKMFIFPLNAMIIFQMSSKDLNINNYFFIVYLFDTSQRKNV